MVQISTWFTLHFDEIIGTIFSLVYLYFSIKQKIWLWPFGIISSSIYIYVFFKAGIYADMGVQVYYVLVSIFGWYNWKKKSISIVGELPVKTIVEARYLMILLIFANIILWFFLSQILIRYTDSNVPYIDSFVTALSIVGTWMLAKKYIENWLVWIIVDSVSVGLYVYKQLYVTVFLYILYTILAVAGYKAWLNSGKSDALSEKSENSVIE